MWIRNAFSNFTEFEKNRKNSENRPKAEAEKQVNSIVFNEGTVSPLGLESSALAEYFTA